MGDDQDRDSGVGSSGSSGDAVVSIYLCVANIDEDARQRCLQYDPEDTVWTVKQTLLASISTEIFESFNYGLFCPPSKGRAGKFLDEERCMKDYGLGSVGKLQLKYKSRVYKDLQPAMMRKEKLARIQSMEILLKLMSKVMKGQVDRVKKLTGKGVDPNFIDPESGETPLTFSVRLDDPKPVMLALVEGGAHLDFRNSQSLTALHCAALRCSRKAISALLELGSSTNHQDCLGLTPLYHCVLARDAVTALECIDLLLYDHAATDVVDDKGWTPLHQVCRSGRVQILDKLIFYGADINCLNGNGNTPLHICALNNQEECARLLLFRGAIKSIPNNSSVDAQFLATKAGNERLVETITSFQPKDVVPYTEQPKRNPLRRTSPWIGSSGTMPRPRTIADFSGGSRTALGSVGRQASLQLNGSASTPPGDEENRSIGKINRSSTLQLSSMQFSSQEHISRIEPSQHHHQQQVALTGAYDEYANLENFAPVTAVNASKSTSAVMASTTQWKNHQTAEMKKAAAAEKEEYENLDECLQRSHVYKTSKNQLPYGSESTTFLVSGSQHRAMSVTSTSSQWNEQRKPMPPPASAKPKPAAGAEQYDDIVSSGDSTSIISGTGSLSSSGSATLTNNRPPMPQFGSSMANASSNSDEHSFALDAENLRREMLRKKFARVSSDDGLGESIHSPTDGGSTIYEPPPMPTWMPPPPPMMTNNAIVTNSAVNHQPQQRQPQQQSTSSSSSHNTHQGGAVSIGDDGFRELLARKAEQRTIADPTEQKRTMSVVNSTGPLVTLRKTATMRHNEDVSPQVESKPLFGSKPPPLTKQKNVRPTLKSSTPIVQSSSPNPLGHTHIQPPPSAPPTVTDSAFRRQTASTGFRLQTEAKKSPFSPPSSVVTNYSSVDVDDINSMILPPPPDDFLFNCPSSPTTAGLSPPFYPTSPEKFTTTTFCPPSYQNSTEVLSSSQAFKANNSATSVSRPNQLPVSSATHQTMNCPPAPKHFGSTPQQNAVAGANTTPSAAFARTSVAPKVIPTPYNNNTPGGGAFTKASQVSIDAVNIAPPVAFSEGNRRREVAAAVVMQWKSTTEAKTRATGSKSGQSAMVDWSQDDVQRWLESIQMSGHRDAFRTACVDGRRLIAMTDDDLYYMGVREAGQRLMLARAIKTALAND